MPGFKRNSRTRRRIPIKITPKTAKRIIAISTPIIVLTILILGIRTYQSNIQIANQRQKAEEQIHKVINEVDYSKIEGEKPVAQDTVINIIALGNIICEQELYEKLYSYPNDSYLFIQFLDRVQQYIGIADYTIANLESNFINLYNRKNEKPVVPTDLGIALKSTGIDLINTASVHSNDYGKEGIEQTLDYLDDLELEHIGTNKTQEESQQIKIVDIHGINVAFLAYTENLNVAVNTKEKYLVNRLDANQVNQDIQKAKEKGAEFVCVCINWGDSKAVKATNAQKELANKLVDNGADLIIGTHPNVAFEIDKKKNKDGKDVCIIYSLGNFMSLGEKLQISLDVEITKSVEDGQVRLTNVTYNTMYLLYKGAEATEKYMLADVKQEIDRFEARVQNNLTQEDYETIKSKLIELENRLKAK